MSAGPDYSTVTGVRAYAFYASMQAALWSFQQPAWGRGRPTSEHRRPRVPPPRRPPRSHASLLALRTPACSVGQRRRGDRKAASSELLTCLRAVAQGGQVETRAFLPAHRTSSARSDRRLLPPSTQDVAVASVTSRLRPGRPHGGRRQDVPAPKGRLWRRRTSAARAQVPRHRSQRIGAVFPAVVEVRRT